MKNQFVLSFDDEANAQSFNLLLEDFKKLMYGETYFTVDLKRSAAKIQSLIDVWLAKSKGMFEKMLNEFQSDFNACLKFVRDLPEKINTFWQKKIHLWYRYVKNLFAAKPSFAACTAHETIILQHFRASKSDLSKSPSLRTQLGIDEHFERTVTEEEGNEFPERVRKDPFLNYESLQQIIKANPVSKDPTRDLRNAGNAQLDRLYKRWGGDLSENV